MIDLSISVVNYAESMMIWNRWFKSKLSQIQWLTFGVFVAKLIEKKTSFNTQSKSKKLIYYPVNKLSCVTYMDNSHFFAQGKIIVSDFVYATLEIWLSCSFHGDNDHYVENKAFLICRCSCLIIGVSLVYSECFCCVLRFDRYFFLICNINCNIN